MVQSFTSQCLTVCVLLSCVSNVFGISCVICPGIFDDSDKDKCCASEYGIPKCCTSIEYHMQILKDGINGALKDWPGNVASGDWNGNKPLQDNRDWEINTTFDGDSKFPTVLIVIGMAALFATVVTCYIFCLCCPCCILYKRRKRGAVYRRVVTPTVTVPQANQSSAAVVPNPQHANGPQATTVASGLMPSMYNQPPQPGEANFPQATTVGPPMGYTGYNAVHHPQVAVQPPPPYSVAVAGDPYPKQAPYNPLYQQ